MHTLVTGASVTLFTDLFTAFGVLIWLFLSQLGAGCAGGDPRAVAHHQLPLASPAHADGEPPAPAQLAAGYSASSMSAWPTTGSFAPSARRWWRRIRSASASRTTTRTTTAWCGAIPCSRRWRSISPASGNSSHWRWVHGCCACMRRTSRRARCSRSIGYLGMLYTPIVNIVAANVVIQKGVTAMEKIFALLDTKPHVPDNDALPAFPRDEGQSGIPRRVVRLSHRGRRRWTA